jgi:hypothetical protein
LPEDGQQGPKHVTVKYKINTSKIVANSSNDLGLIINSEKQSKKQALVLYFIGCYRWRKQALLKRRQVSSFQRGAVSPQKTFHNPDVRENIHHSHEHEPDLGNLES